MSANKPLDDAIIIGIDFGTTFSGVAWAHCRRPEHIELVTSWEAEFSHCSDVEKAPSQLHYAKNEKRTTWGYSVPPDVDALKWFKLLLLDDRDLPSTVSDSAQLREARRLRKAANKDPVKIIGCFLRKIWNHSIDSIQRTIGADMLQKSKFHVVITLPAIWPAYSQQRMKQAAAMSGILDERSCGETTLRFISEPEAAALATIEDLVERTTIKVSHDSPQVGRVKSADVEASLVIPSSCATLEVALSYVIKSTEPFVVKECVEGDGDLCGAVFLDENFLNLIKRKLPKGSWNNVSKADEKKFLNDGWEHGIKPQFENQSRNWLIDLPENCTGSSFKGLKRRRSLQLTSDEVLSVFRPVVDKIEALVRRQTDAIEANHFQPPKYIVLVGGFGRSRYLFNRLQKQFGSTILQARGTKPWTAICRGAVVQGLTTLNMSPTLGVKVEERVARMSYGTDYATDFVPRVHRKEDRYWSETRQKYQAGGQMHWFLRKGDSITNKHPVQRSYLEYFSDRIDKMTTEIFCSEKFPPPSRKDRSVRRLCQIIWNREIVPDSLPTYTNPIGKVYYKLEHDIEMTCEDGTLDFTVYYNGERVGARNIEIKFD
ncbi:hypothetical protein FDECE_12894 [Fusarium decemcellulare]|nr:hypothetical protein FDECE_12894 [Fusarium decemcellulare]